MEVETYPADFISIHAPVKGATPRLGRGHRAGHDFNPRSREGSDPGPKLAQRILIISIHAPVKGATCPLGLTLKVTVYFNPRSREGSDTRIGQCRAKPEISIHAPVKGATWLDIVQRAYGVFQSTLP